MKERRIKQLLKALFTHSTECRLMSSTGYAKSAVCNSRIHTRSNNIIKPTTSSELISGHFHGPDPAKLEMLKA